MSLPNYFIQTISGELFGYYDPVILLCDLGGRRAEAVGIKILRLGRGRIFMVQYFPITEAELRAEVDFEEAERARLREEKARMEGVL